MEAYATARKPVVYVNTLERLALRRALRLLTFAVAAAGTGILVGVVYARTRKPPLS